MGYLVFIKNRRLCSMEDEHIELLKNQALKPKKQGVKEYSSIFGWFLSWFGVAFKAFDCSGNKVFLNRKSFCKQLMDLRRQQKAKKVLKRTQVLKTKNPSQIEIEPPYRTSDSLKEHVFKPSNELNQIMSIFQKEMSELKEAEGGRPPNLVALYEVLRDDLICEIDRIEDHYYP